MISNLSQAIFLGLALTTSAAIGSAQGDTCATATPISGTGSFAFNSLAASTSGFDGGGQCAAGASNVTKDVFWQWTVPADGDYRLTTNGSNFDTRLSAHRGIGCAAVCDSHNNNGADGDLSRINLDGLVAGEDFLLQVGGVSVFGIETAGEGFLSIALKPGSDCSTNPDDSLEPNDNCNQATAIGAGSYNGLIVTYQDRDFYRVTVAQGERLDVTCIWNLTSAWPVQVALLDTSCNVLVGPNQSSLTYLNNQASSDFLLRVTTGFAPGVCVDYNMVVDIDRSPCLMEPDDGFEPNDSCAAPVDMAPGFYPSLFLVETFPDYYRVVLPPSQRLRVSVSDGPFGDDTFDVKLALFDENCVESMVSFNSLATISNDTNLDQLWIIETRVSEDSEESCGTHSMQIVVEPDTCLAFDDDPLENNDDCYEENRLGDGFYGGLWTSKTDWDFYRFLVAPGGTINIDIDLPLFPGDVDAYLYRTDNCKGVNLGDIGCSGALDCGEFLGGETLTWTNSTGQGVYVTAKILVYANSSSDCGVYDMTVSGTVDPGEIVGVSYCGPAVPNQTGKSAVLVGYGSTAVADNALTLVALPLPFNEPGYILASRNPGFLPFPGGSAGNLCLSGTIARLNRPGEVVVVGQPFVKEIEVQLDLLDIPEPPSLGVAIQPGETWFFQCWHRDFLAGSPTSNFTAALEVTFQ